MAQGYYTYHIRIDNQKHVEIEKRGSAGDDLGEPRGAFRYTERAARLQELHRSAFADELAEDGVRELGELLFDALFDEKLRLDFFTLYETAVKAGDYVRITLDIDEQELPEVAALPWEFLRVPSNAGYGTVIFGTNPQIVFARRRARWTPPAPIQLPPEERLRIAVAAAAPKSTDAVKLGPIQYEKAWEELKAVADSNPDRIELLDLIRDATAAKIDAVLKQRPHIFHFIGHGRLRDANGQEIGEIILSDGILNNADLYSATEFSQLFDRHRPGVVLLHACEGGALSTSQVFAGVASQIVEQNIPVIVAMQFEISNFTARRFVETFYLSLAAGQPVDLAVQEGRRQIALGPQRHKTREFATPVLFMRPRDGRLFDVAAQQAAPTAQPEPASGGGLPSTIVLLGLVDKLLKCPSISNRGQRDTVVVLLEPDVQSSIIRSNSAKDDVFNIVKTSAEYPGGIKALIEAVRFFERGSFAMQDVEAYLTSQGIVV